ncbi:MAG: sigma 54-interacting transcriptional regulator [Atribacterota bacterium]|nr:sigma 54-interacting transcriptional regulator [Atribacterota bacterium]
MEEENIQTGNIQTIQKAWIDFVEHGKINHTVVRPEIADSWIRCKRIGLNPYSKNIGTNNFINIQSLLEKNNFLIRISTPFLNMASDLIAGSGFKINLVDPNGYVLKLITHDEEAIKKSKEIGSIVGGNRSELFAGTNGIGLALVLGKTVQVVGPEHFNYHSHSWTCACAPIRDHRNKIIGAVNISAYSQSIHRHTKGMAGSIATAIENAILIEQKIIELKNINKFLETLIDSIYDGLIVVDTQNKITNINSIGAEILGIELNHSIGEKIDKIDQIDLSLLEIFETKRQYIDKIITLSMPFNKDRRQVLVNSRFIKDNYLNITHKMAIFGEMKRIQRLAIGILGAKARFTFEDIVYKSEQMERVIQIAKKIARSNSKVLITGESGTGKELFAQSIHNESIRMKKPFIAINCAALPRDLVESELFGYDEGAFTGAKKGGNPGKFELVDGGTLFLDEIESMPLDLQPKLLRVIESSEVMRLGGNKLIPINVRVISSTNKELSLSIQEGKFREDLFYRLNTTTINIPPLRERKEDISVLVEYFVTKLGYQFNINLEVNSKAFIALLKYDWPGNVRELENVIENIIILSPNNRITYDLLPDRIKNYIIQNTNKNDVKNNIEDLSNMNLEDMEKNMILFALKRNNGNNTKTALALGVDRTTLLRKKKKYQID